MLTLKLFRIGRKNRPHYRIVVMEKRLKANGSYIDQLGIYDPYKENNSVTLNVLKLKEWVSKGAKLSEGVAKLLKKYDTKTT